MHIMLDGDRNDRKDEVVLCLHRTAFTEARRIHLCEDDALDCAMELVLHALTQAQAAGSAAKKQAVETAESVGDTDTVPEAALASVTIAHLVLRADLCPDQTARWLRRCARNFALNYRRRVVARCRHEVKPSGSGLSEGSENAATVNATVPASLRVPPAEYDALNNLLHQDVLAAMHELPPHAREVFARFHIDGDNLAEIAFSSGKTQNAVKKQMHRMRHHVRTALIRQGHGPEGYNATPGEDTTREQQTKNQLKLEEK